MGKPSFFCHINGIVEEGSSVGSGTRIWAGAHILAGATVGSNCNIGEHCFLESGVRVGNGVTIKNNVALYTGAIIEDDVFLGPSCVFTNVMTPRAFVSRKNEFLPTRVCKGASIGANVTIVCGHTIGQYAMVGAGSVVTRDVPAYALVYGVPAKVQGYVCKCGETLSSSSERWMCSSCKRTYHFVAGALLADEDKEENEDI